MKNLFRLVVAAAAVFPYHYAGAAFTSALQIVGLDVGDTNALFIKLSANTECGTSIAYISSTEPYYRDVLALASAAYAMGQPVQIWVGSCNSANRAQIRRLVVGSVW